MAEVFFNGQRAKAADTDGLEWICPHCRTVFALDEALPHLGEEHAECRMCDGEQILISAVLVIREQRR